jgi:hypothetical protein
MALAADMASQRRKFSARPCLFGSRRYGVHLGNNRGHRIKGLVIPRVPRDERAWSMPMTAMETIRRNLT